MRDQAKRPSAKDYRDHLGAVQSAANQLRMCIINTFKEKPDVFSKLDWGLRKSIGLELRGRPGAGAGLEHQLGTLARLCEEGMNVEGAPGRHNKNHVDVAALALARLWIEVSGKPFIKTFVPWHDHDRAGGELRFVEPGPRFVETILKVIAHALAPELEGNEIQSRIRVALTGFDISKRGSGNAQTRAE